MRLGDCEQLDTTTADAAWYTCLEEFIYANDANVKPNPWHGINPETTHRIFRFGSFCALWETFFGSKRKFNSASSNAKNDIGLRFSNVSFTFAAKEKGYDHKEALAGKAGITKAAGKMNTHNTLRQYLGDLDPSFLQKLLNTNEGTVKCISELNGYFKGPLTVVAEFEYEWEGFPHPTQFPLAKRFVRLVVDAGDCAGGWELGTIPTDRGQLWRFVPPAATF